MPDRLSQFRGQLQTDSSKEPGQLILDVALELEHTLRPQQTLRLGPRGKRLSDLRSVEVTRVVRFDDRRRGKLGWDGNFSASRRVLDNERAATVYRPAK